VRLYGHLGQRFGKRHRFAVATPAEAVRALASQHAGFAEYLIAHSEPGYRVIVGDEQRGLEQLVHPCGQRETIRIVPVVTGAGSGKGVVGLVLGAALIAIGGPVGFVQGLAWSAGATAGTAAAIGAAVGSLGWAIALGGISSLLFAPPKPVTPEARERPENRPSYAFDGAVNMSVQGAAVPLLYGRLRVGSVVVSAGLYTEQIA
jgi:predicted phage tail protein